MTSGIKHSVVWLTGASPAQCDSRGLSASLETSLPPLPNGEDSPSRTPVDLQLSFPYTVAAMGGSEVTTLLKPACLPLYKCDI